jgi:hypothetical protein
LRDLNVVEYWTKRAQEGEFERDALLGYLTGIPTYAQCRTRFMCATPRECRGRAVSAEACGSRAADLTLLQIIQP